MIRLLFRNIVISWNNGHSINRFLFMSKFSYNASKMCTHVIWIFRMLPNYNSKFIIIYFEGDLAQKVNRLWRGLKTFKSRVLYAVRALGIGWDEKNAARADNPQKIERLRGNGLLAGKSKAARRLQRWMKNITVMKAIISTASPVSLEYSMAESLKGGLFP